MQKFTRLLETFRDSAIAPAHTIQDQQFGSLRVRFDRHDQLWVLESDFVFLPGKPKGTLTLISTKESPLPAHRKAFTEITQAAETIWTNATQFLEANPEINLPGPLSEKCTIDLVVIPPDPVGEPWELWLEHPRVFWNVVVDFQGLEAVHWWINA